MTSGTAKTSVDTKSDAVDAGFAAGDGNEDPAVSLGFKEAHTIAMKSGCADLAAWKQWCKTDARPDGILVAADTAYAKSGWVSWEHWLNGTEKEEDAENVRIEFIQGFLLFFFFGHGCFLAYLGDVVDVVLVWYLLWPPLCVRIPTGHSGSTYSL